MRASRVVAFCLTVALGTLVLAGCSWFASPKTVKDSVVRPQVIEALATSAQAGANVILSCVAIGDTYQFDAIGAVADTVLVQDIDIADKTTGLFISGDGQTLTGVYCHNDYVNATSGNGITVVFSFTP
jgi:hypothetical protein